MIVEDNFFPDPNKHPPTVTITELCERFTGAGLPCKAERLEGEVRILFRGHKSNLVFTVNPSGYLLTATMPGEPDFDVDFACVVFDVFDSIGWIYAPE